MLRRSIAVMATALLYLHTVTLAQEPSPDVYERPVLVLDPGVHTAMLRSADVDAVGRIAVTGSDDRTVRVWSVVDGRLLRSIRVPLGPENVGKIYAVAISPDGAVIAAGGWTRWTEADPQEQIYIFDAATGSMTGRIEGLPQAVTHLAFSPGGDRLAATLFGGVGLRLYDRRDGWAELARDENYGDASYGAAFAPDGRLATTNEDGRVRLYDAAGTLVHSVATDIEPFGIAFSPDGERLAVGFFDVPEVRLYDSNSLDPLPPPDVAGIDNGNLSEVAWSSDGETLYAGGRYDVGGDFVVVAWGDAGSGPRRILPGGLNTVTSLRPLPSGDLLVAASDPWLGLLGADGTTTWSRRPEQMDARGQSNSLSVSADGMVVDFGYEVFGRRHTRFDLASLTISADPPKDGRTAAPVQEGLDIQDWQGTGRPTLEEVPLQLMAYETSRSLAVHPDGGRFVLGTVWVLRSFDADGTELWSRIAPGAVGAVNITGDGRLVVAAYDDGTIRWHRVEDGVEILAFFPIIDGENWVAWTPEGVYAATPGARRVLRWHVNRGWDHAAEAVPVSQIPETHRPEVIPHVLPQLGTAGAIAVAELTKIRAAVQNATQAAVGPGARLHVVAVGVSEYGEKSKHLRLDYAHADAHDLASALLTSQSGLYAEVVLQLLQDRDATRGGILRALDTAEKAMAKGTGNDLAVVHFSGHGAVIDGMFYLLPHDLDARDPVAIEATALAAVQFGQKVAKLARHGRVIVLLDACRSGATTAGGAKLETDAEVLRALMRSPNVTVLTSSSAGEDSREDKAWGNGAFTKVVLEALTTAADSDRNGVLSMLEISRYVAERVPQITGGQQTPGIDLRFGSNVFVAGL